MKYIQQGKIEQIRRRFRRLYGEQVDRLEERFISMIGRYGVGLDVAAQEGSQWSHKDVMLITYADMVQTEGETPLKTLKGFCSEYLKGAINIVHVLPFYPWTSDDGFSVVDYREVEKSYGTWKDMENLSDGFDTMYDLVLNHCSRKSQWFKDYQVGIAPGRHYFLEMDPDTDLSQVVRPRTSPLLSKATTRFGESWIWTTFSEDQVDLNWQNPDLLFEFLDILFLYISKGVRLIRLDAVAFTWKNLGTDCLHQPETHEIVKLLRDVCEMVAPDVILLTETNVPHAENVSYFGRGDEAQMVYNFSLSPLLLHGLLTENSHFLTEWATNLEYPDDSCTFLNFTASHDGVGVRPLQGLLPDDEFSKLITEVESRGAIISKKKNADGSESPYELNITYASALSDANDESLGLQRFFCSQAVALAFKGVPAVYFHSLLANYNDVEGYEESGIPRRLNRKKSDRDEVVQVLKDKESLKSVFFNRYVKLMRRRAGYPAFHPDGKQTIHDLGNTLFALERVSPNGNQTVYCLFNFKADVVKIPVKDLGSEVLPGSEKLYDIVSGKTLQSAKRRITLQPYQVVWLVPR